MFVEISREDAGDWHIEIKNDVGTLNLPFKVKVKGNILIHLMKPT